MTCRTISPHALRGLLILCLAAPLMGCEKAPAPLRGLYFWGAEVNVVCPCGTELCYWVRGEREILDPLKLYVQKQTSQPYQPVYLTYRGRFLDEAAVGFAANYDGYQVLKEVLSVSVHLPADCPPP
jgi:hypothetical protein